MATENLMVELVDTTARWTGGQDIARATQSVFDHLSVNELAFLLGVLLSFALVVTMRPMGKPMIAPAIRLLWRALVCVSERLRNVILDKLIEAMIVALVVVLAGIPWLAPISELLSEIFR